MPIPGDLTLLSDLKSYMGGANPNDTSNDALLTNLVGAASVFIARYLDRDLMSLGGQGFSTIVSVGRDAGGAFISVSPELPVIPAAGTRVLDPVTSASAIAIAPSAGLVSSTGKIYLDANLSFAGG